MGRDEKSADTAEWIAEKYYKIDGRSPSKSEMRNVYRYIENLVDKKIIIRADEGGGSKKKRYFANLGVVSSLIGEDTALDIIRSFQFLAAILGDDSPLLNEKSDFIARREIAGCTLETRRLRGGIKFIPEGVGRPATKVSSETVKEALKSIRDSRQIKLVFYNESGEEVEKDLSVRGLIFKDGTWYLVGTVGTNDSGRAYALQRVIRALCLPKSASTSDFNLDEFANKNFTYGNSISMKSFPLQKDPSSSADPLQRKGSGARKFRSAERPVPASEPFELTLRVAPRALFHFEERNLGMSQKIFMREDATDDDPASWSELTTKIPYTVQLVPFLLSLGQWIVVVSPDEVRKQMAVVAESMANLYSGRC